MPGQTRPWFNFIREQVSISAPPKCGNTTTKIAAQTYRRAPRTEFPQFEEQYWICRNPIDRFRSLYKNKIQAHGNVRNMHRKFFDKHVHTPEELFAYVKHDVLTNPDLDNHWKPQAQIRAEARGEGAILVPLHHLSTLLPVAKKQNVTHSETIELSDELQQDIFEFYFADYEMYLEAALLDPTSLPIINPPGM
jgi:hypothetical protein